MSSKNIILSRWSTFFFVIGDSIIDIQADAQHCHSILHLSGSIFLLCEIPLQVVWCSFCIEAYQYYIKLWTQLWMIGHDLLFKIAQNTCKTRLCFGSSTFTTPNFLSSQSQWESGFLLSLLKRYQWLFFFILYAQKY